MSKSNPIFGLGNLLKINIKMDFEIGKLHITSNKNIIDVCNIFFTYLPRFLHLTFFSLKIDRHH